MKKKLALTGLFAAIAAVILTSFASAAVTTVVTPSNTQGWSTADTRPGGAVDFVLDPTSPYPDGALQLSTNASTTAKAQYLHTATTSLADVTNLSYYTKHVSGPDYAAPSFQLLVQLNGTSSGFTTLVYEPYQNGTVASSTWQQWDVDAGQFWSSRSFTDGTCSVTAGGGGAPFYTLADLKTMCPNATVIGFGVNVGSNNPNYTVLTDGVTFNDTVYDFQTKVDVVDVDTQPPTLPVHLSPANGATTTTAALTMIDWTDSTDASSSPVMYYYESSLSNATNTDGSFVSPAYQSGALATSSIPAGGTPEGTYYWHVRAVDAAGNSTAWTTPWSIIVSNTVTPPTPTGPKSKDDCKNGGFAAFGFRNQGQCVSSVVSNRPTTTPVGTTTPTTTPTTTSSSL